MLEVNYRILWKTSYIKRHAKPEITTTLHCILVLSIIWRTQLLTLKSVFTYILNSSEPDFTASKEQWLQMACNHKTATLCEEFSYQLHKHVYLLNSICGRVHRAVGSHSPHTAWIGIWMTKRPGATSDNGFILKKINKN